MTAGGTTNENNTAHFKEWIAAIKHKNRYTTSRDGWLQLVGRNYFCEIKKLCTLKNNFSLRLNTVTYNVKMFLGTTTLLWITVFSYEPLFL